MVFGGSIFRVFTGWVAWIYMLSLFVLLGIPDSVPVAPPRPNVRFVDFEQPFTCAPGSAPNALTAITVQVSEPFNRDLEIPLKAIRGTAVPVEHYEADSDAAVFIKAGQTVGYIRERDGRLDVLVRAEGGNTSPRRFVLELQNTHDVVVAADPQGRRNVELLAGSGSHPATAPLTPTEFTEQFVAVAERDFIDQLFVVRANRRIEADSDVVIELRGGIGDDATLVERFTVTMRQGAEEVSFRLRDELSLERLNELGLTDNEWPGPDEFYEFHADPRPPALIAKTDPCFMAVLVTDDDGSVNISQILEDQAGRTLARVMPDEQYWIVPELSRPLERDCRVVPVIDGQRTPPGGIIPAGKVREPRFGPFLVASNREKIVIASDGALEMDGPSLCATCNGDGGSCPDCQPKGACKSCDGRPGGCTACRAGTGGCRGCNGRPGGCLACGFGHGACGACGGAGGPCSACGGGSGGGGGPDGPVGPSSPRDVNVGPPVEGDFLLLLVNNQRLHEPGDGITESVLEAIRNERAYGNAAIVVNQQGESELKYGKVPDPATAFQPFGQKGDDLAGQVNRLTETIAAKRENAAKQSLPTVIIWPERELSSAPDLAMLADLAAKGGGPISVLCPDAAPENARRLADALRAPEGAQNLVTVRSPKTPELAEHIRDVILADPRRPAAPGGESDK